MTNKEYNKIVKIILSIINHGLSLPNGIKLIEELLE